MARPKQRMFSAPDLLPPGLRTCFLVVDIGFIFYWGLVAFDHIPRAWLFKNHDEPLLMDWSRSFMVLYALIACTGLLSLYLAARRSGKALPMALLSLAFSFCAGLQALSFWTLRSDFSWIWWLPNLFLLLYPLPFLLFIVKRSGR
jgi:hypothetical protein